MSENEEEDFLPESFPCERCHAGMLQPRLIPYFTWLGKELITVPNFPAWICDVCGRREYDEQAIQWLNTLLNPEAGKPTQPQRGGTPFPRPHSSAPQTRLDS